VGRILALDYGRQRIGVAVSDLLGATAQPFDTWEGLKFEQIVDKLCLLIRKLEIEKIIMGLPLTLKGEKGKLARDVEQITMRLRQHIKTPILLWDERFTSVQAERLLQQANEKPSRQKKKIDVIAAILLLQNYLDFQRRVKINNIGESI
jgi:putative Holliday junction resolvase